jgi:DNA-binding Lrp family transcriptional regulator
MFALLFVKYYPEMASNAEMRIREVKGVVESYLTSGAYDMILKVKAKNEAELRRTIKKTAKISGVGSILTSIVYNIPV